VLGFRHKFFPAVSTVYCHNERCNIEIVVNLSFKRLGGFMVGQLVAFTLSVLELEAEWHQHFLIGTLRPCVCIIAI
jgi:hypothetical protein